jgi:oligosaccharide repeat unit polymerase
LWVLTLAWYQYKNHTIDAGTAIVSTYVMYAVFSLITINDEFFSISFNPLKLFPFIYLYVMLMIALSPTIYHHLNPPKSIADPNTRILSFTALIIIVMSFFLIPEILSNIDTGLVKLFTNSDAGNDAYIEQIEENTDQGSKIRNIPGIIYNALSDLPMFLCFYFMTLKEKKYGLILGLLFAIFIGILLPIVHGQRGGVIISILTSIVGYMLFKPYISERINRYFRIFGISFVAIISIPIIAITLSRFGENAVGVGGIVNWYVGQENLYFNNYGLDAGGIRNGDRTMFLLKRAIDPDTPKNYTERREKYHNLKIDDYFFYTFVGDFTIDFGPVVAFVIFVVFNIVILFLIRPRDGTIQLYQLLLLYFSMCICMQGGMALFSFSDYEGLRIVVVVLLYTYLRYHQLLLEKFPLFSSIPSERED